MATLQGAIYAGLGATGLHTLEEIVRHSQSSYGPQALDASTLLYFSQQDISPPHELIQTYSLTAGQTGDWLRLDNLPQSARDWFHPALQQQSPASFAARRQQTRARFLHHLQQHQPGLLNFVDRSIFHIRTATQPSQPVPVFVFGAFHDVETAAILLDVINLLRHRMTVQQLSVQAVTVYALTRPPQTIPDIDQAALFAWLREIARFLARPSELTISAHLYPEDSGLMNLNCQHTRLLDYLVLYDYHMQEATLQNIARMWAQLILLQKDPLFKPVYDQYEQRNDDYREHMKRTHTRSTGPFDNIFVNHQTTSTATFPLSQLRQHWRYQLVNDRLQPWLMPAPLALPGASAMNALQTWLHSGTGQSGCPPILGILLERLQQDTRIRIDEEIIYALNPPGEEELPRLWNWELTSEITRQGDVELMKDHITQQLQTRIGFSEKAEATRFQQHIHQAVQHASQQFQQALPIWALHQLNDPADPRPVGHLVAVIRELQNQLTRLRSILESLQDSSREKRWQELQQLDDALSNLKRLTTPFVNFETGESRTFRHRANDYIHTQQQFLTCRALLNLLTDIEHEIGHLLNQLKDWQTRLSEAAILDDLPADPGLISSADPAPAHLLLIDATWAREQSHRMQDILATRFAAHIQWQHEPSRIHSGRLQLYLAGQLLPPEQTGHRLPWQQFIEQVLDVEDNVFSFWGYLSQAEPRARHRYTLTNLFQQEINMLPHQTRSNDDFVRESHYLLLPTTGRFENQELATLRQTLEKNSRQAFPLLSLEELQNQMSGALLALTSMIRLPALDVFQTARQAYMQTDQPDYLYVLPAEATAARREHQITSEPGRVSDLAWLPPRLVGIIHHTSRIRLFAEALHLDFIQRQNVGETDSRWVIALPGYTDTPLSDPSKDPLLVDTFLGFCENEVVSRHLNYDALKEACDAKLVDHVSQRLQQDDWQYPDDSCGKWARRLRGLTREQWGRKQCIYSQWYLAYYQLLRDRLASEALSSETRSMWQLMAYEIIHQYHSICDTIKQTAKKYI